MKINYSSKNMEITSAMETLFTKKLTRLDKYFSDDTAAYVHITNRKNTQKLEITIPVKGSTIRSERVKSPWSHVPAPISPAGKGESCPIGTNFRLSITAWIIRRCPFQWK